MSTKIEGDVYFLLNVGFVKNMATYYSGSGTDNIIFKYDVVLNHWSLALGYDYQQQNVITNGGYIKRVSRHPSTNADLKLPSPNAPFQEHLFPIQVDGKTPVITDIFISNQQSNAFKEGDNISITVEVSSEVAFIGGPPVLAILAGGKYLREAPYSSGNTSNVLKFNYSVVPGDISPPSPISCRMLCVSSGCVQGVSSEGYIKQYSSNLILDADINIPFPKYGKITML